MQSLAVFNQDLMEFLAASPTPFHAVQQMVSRLTAAGFTALNERDDWALEVGHRYYVVRNQSSLIAFVYQDGLTTRGFRMVGAHTDSPCLRVKPQPELHRHGYFQLGVEVYGGVLLKPWFDRDLSLAGRVTYQTVDHTVKSALIDFKKPIAVIPSLAIHLDREQNRQSSVNPQEDIPPILLRSEQKTDFRVLLQEQLQQQHPAIEVQAVLDYELSFYDTQPPAMVGLQEDFIASARLDNLLSCYIGLQSLLNSGDQPCLLVCNDHEEVGSRSAVGAQGPMLQSVLRRMLPDEVSFSRCMQHSLLISADNAHGIHPNFASKHDGKHGPLLNAGPVIKINANQCYATDSETSALFRYLAASVQEPVQAFVVRTDMACGSTIGPVTAAELGIKTIDVGVPTFAMHSIRELAGARDSYGLYRVLVAFNQLQQLPFA